MAPGFDIVCLAAGYTMSDVQSMKRELKLNWRQVMNIQTWNDVRKHPLFWAEQIFFQHYVCYFPSLEMNLLQSLQLIHHSSKGDTVLWLMYHLYHQSAVYLLKTIKKEN